MPDDQRKEKEKTAAAKNKPKKEKKHKKKGRHSRVMTSHSGLMAMTCLVARMHHGCSSPEMRKTVLTPVLACNQSNSAAFCRPVKFKFLCKLRIMRLSFSDGRFIPMRKDMPAHPINMGWTAAARRVVMRHPNCRSALIIKRSFHSPFFSTRRIPCPSNSALLPLPAASPPKPTPATAA